jgi:hypothetical protein
MLKSKKECSNIKKHARKTRRDPTTCQHDYLKFLQNKVEY